MGTEYAVSRGASPKGSRDRDAPGSAPGLRVRAHDLVGRDVGGGELVAVDLRAALEENQVGIYFAAVLIGLLAALAAPGDAWGAAINPALAALLYVTFLQVPLNGICPNCD